MTKWQQTMCLAYCMGKRKNEVGWKRRRAYILGPWQPERRRGVLRERGVSPFPDALFLFFFLFFFPEVRGGSGGALGQAI
jgi:hypothetical protein